MTVLQWTTTLVGISFAIATALYVMGIDEGRAWAEARGIAACFVVPQTADLSASAPGVDLITTTPFHRRFF